METASDPRALTRIRAFVESACGELVSPPLDQQRTAKVVTAAREVATNIIRHAYRGKANGLIRIEAEATNGRLTIRIWHHGDDFDPKLVGEASSNGWRQGKFGVYIAAQYTDDVQYFTDGHGAHCVSLITNTS
jgi:anti-sigma regulatory factor (Ser/Thr protein kinase)